MDFLVDPLVFSLPSEKAPRQALEIYVDFLIQWQYLFANSTYNFMMSSACVYSLDEMGLYPYLENLEKIWKYAQEETMDVRDVFNACIKVLSNWPFLEERIPHLDKIEIYEDTVRIRPDLLDRQPEAVDEAFRQALGYVAYARAFIPESIASNLLLLTYPISGQSLAEIWATVLAESSDQYGLTDVNIYSDILLVTTPDELLDFMELSDFWEDTERAIRWKARQMQREYLLSPFKVHTTFNESIKANELHLHGGVLDRIFRQCVLLLSREWVAIETHKLGKPQHEVNEWKSFRLYITEGKSGWRLHYWRRGDEFYLVQIPPHDNYDIDEPAELSDKDFRL